jgi:hypothetical protein
VIEVRFKLDEQSTTYLADRVAAHRRQDAARDGAAQPAGVARSAR